MAENGEKWPEVGGKMAPLCLCSVINNELTTVAPEGRCRARQLKSSQRDRSRPAAAGGPLEAAPQAEGAPKEHSSEGQIWICCLPSANCQLLTPQRAERLARSVSRSAL